MDSCRELLTFGYCRKHETEINTNIPFRIMKLITIYHTKYKIIGCGNNKYGQLSIGKEIKLCEWKELKELSNIIPNYNNIYINRQCIMIINQYNKLYISGSSNAIGIGHNSNEQGHIMEVPLNDRNEKIILLSKAIGGRQTFIYCNNNNLYGNGPNNNGELGNGHKTDLGHQLESIPRFWNEKEILIDIQCGDGHTLFLTSNNNLYSCGFRIGETYNGHNCNDYTLTPILMHENITQIAVGWCHNLLLNKNNDLIIFGRNFGSYYARDHGIISYFGQNNIKIKQVCAGSYHSLIIDMNGNCYSFGRNEYGQCGVGYKSSGYGFGITIPQLILLNNEFITQGACGENHNILLSNKNNVYCFGCNINNQCSPSINTNYILSPHCLHKENELKIDKKSYIDFILACSDESIIIINTNKKTHKS